MLSRGLHIATETVTSYITSRNCDDVVTSTDDDNSLPGSNSAMYSSNISSMTASTNQEDLIRLLMTSPPDAVDEKSLQLCADVILASLEHEVQQQQKYQQLQQPTTEASRGAALTFVEYNNNDVIMADDFKYSQFAPELTASGAGKTSLGVTADWQEFESPKRSQTQLDEALPSAAVVVNGPGGGGLVIMPGMGQKTGRGPSSKKSPSAKKAAISKTTGRSKCAPDERAPSPIKGECVQGAGGEGGGGGQHVGSGGARRNERERNRVRQVNLGFDRLRQHVPQGRRNKKLSKVDTLKAAVDYISRLRELLMSTTNHPCALRIDDITTSSDVNDASGVRYVDDQDRSSSRCGSDDVENYSSNNDVNDDVKGTWHEINDLQQPQHQNQQQQQLQQQQQETSLTALLLEHEHRLPQLSAFEGVLRTHTSSPAGSFSPSLSQASTGYENVSFPMVGGGGGRVFMEVDVKQERVDFQGAIGHTLVPADVLDRDANNDLFYNSIPFSSWLN